MDRILLLIEQYGYLVVFFGVMLESVGIPFPGETILVAAGFMVYQGTLKPAETVVLGVFGSVVGNQLGYWLGRAGGRPFVLRWGHYVGLSSERLARAEGFFARHGGKSVFLARFVPWLRAFGALVAGVSRMRGRIFSLYNVVAGAVWATASVMLGYLFGESLGLVEAWVGLASVLVVVLLALVGLAFYLAHR